jgi:hypothetical protein
MKQFDWLNPAAGLSFYSRTRPSGWNYLGERGNQFVSITAQFLHSLVGKFFNDALAARGKFHKNYPMICAAMCATQQSHASEAVNAFDGCVVANKKTRRKALNRGAAPLRHTANGEQELKLLGFQACRPRRFFAIGHEQANLVAEFRERTIVAFC